MSKKQEPNDTTVQLLWELLRTLEEKCGYHPTPLDAMLIRNTYIHISQLTGRTYTPTYLSA